MILDKDAILAAKDRAIKRVSVPEWGGEVCIRPPDGAFAASMTDIAASAKVGKGGFGDIILPLIAACLCDEDGNLLFRLGDINDLSRKSSSAIMLLFQECLRISGISTDAQAAHDNLKKDLAAGSPSD